MGKWNYRAIPKVKTWSYFLTIPKYNQQAPKIYNNKIAWLNVSGEESKGDIILGTISYLPVAGFTAATITGTHPLNVQFTDKSTDEYYYSWNFGDKSSLSTLENPVHKYANAGKYTVTPVLHQLDQKIIYPHYDFKHLTEKYFEIGMKLNDFSIQLVKYCTLTVKNAAGSNAMTKSGYITVK